MTYTETPLDLDPMPADTAPVVVDEARERRLAADRERKRRAVRNGTKPRERKPTPPTGNPIGRPRKDAAPASDTPRTGRPSKAATRERQYTRSLAKVGGVIFLVNRADGEAFLQGVPDVAKALAAVAEQNPRIAKVLDAGASAGVWLELASALGAIGVPVLCNHGVLPVYMAALLAGDTSAFLAATPAAPGVVADLPADLPADPPAPDSFTVA